MRVMYDIRYFYMVVYYILILKDTQGGMSHLKIAGIQTVGCFCDHQFCSMILNLRERNILCVRTVTDIGLHSVLEIGITCTFATHVVCATQNNCRCQQFTNRPSSTLLIMLLLTNSELYCIV